MNNSLVQHPMTMPLYTLMVQNLKNDEEYYRFMIHVAATCVPRSRATMSHTGENLLIQSEDQTEQPKLENAILTRTCELHVGCYDRVTLKVGMRK